MTINEDGSRVVSGSRDKTVKVWDLASGELLQTLEGHSWVCEERGHGCWACGDRE